MPAAVRHHWTAEEVRNLQPDWPAWPRYELIDGELYVTPSPGGWHQLAIGELFVAIATYVKDRRIGVALTSPADIELEEGSVLQPDIFVVPPLEESAEEFDWRDVRSLLLAVEVISPSSVRTDRVEKRDKYMSMAVAEYWVVDVDGRRIERWLKGRPNVEIARERLVWQPAGALAPLAIDLPELFRSVRRAPR